MELNNELLYLDYGGLQRYHELILAQLEGKVNTNDSRLSDSRPASDVSSWAKESTKPSYTAAEVGAIPSTEKGVASGVATLDANGLVPSSLLPSYVDDVIELLAMSASAPEHCTEGDYYYNTTSKKIIKATGIDTWSSSSNNPESSKIYIDLSSNKGYRWGGTTMVEISSSLAIGSTTGTAADGKVVADHIADTNNPHSVTASLIGLGNVGNFKAVSTEASQGLTSTEQANARTNIGAGTSSFSGSYNDLSDKPTNVSDFTNDAGYLTSHQDISGKANSSDLATVATSGDYSDLTNKPTIPTKVSDLTNDSGYLTSHLDISGKQDNLVFNTTYNATSNKVATMADIPTVFDVSNDGLAPAASNANKATAESTLSNYYLCADGKYRLLPANAFESGNLDYTTEELEIISITDSLAATALRKTALNLTSEEKVQVLQNLGLNNKQEVIDASHKLNADLVDDSTSTNKLVSADEKQTWNGKQDALVFNTAYNASTNKAATMADMPTEMAASGSGHKGGLVPDTPSTAGTTKYLREDGTWAEVPAAQIQSDWSQSDDTQKDFIKNKPTIPTVPTISTDISADASSDVKTASPKAVKTYVDTNTPTVMGASGDNHKGGLVPDPGATEGTTKFLREDGTWQVPAGGSAIPNNIALLENTDSTAYSPDFDAETDTVHVTAQSLTTAQKTQARTNIGAADASTAVNSTAIRNIVTISQADYDDLSSKDNNTLYIIT